MKFFKVLPVPEIKTARRSFLAIANAGQPMQYVVIVPDFSPKSESGTETALVFLAGCGIMASLMSEFLCSPFLALPVKRTSSLMTKN
jgi:hypothetical protein